MTSKFKLHEGLLAFNNRPIAYCRPGTSVTLILSNARNGFTAEDHAEFDRLIYSPDATSTRSYIDNFDAYFNASKRYADFVAGTNLLTDSGIVFTAQELAVSKTLASIKAKIDAAFKLPTLPYATVPGVDLKAIFRTQTLVERAAQWLADDSMIDRNHYGLQNAAAQHGYEKANLLRIHATPSMTKVQSLSGYEMTEAVAKRLWPRLKAKWSAMGSTSSSQYVTSHGGRNINVYPTYMKIGCQYIPRAEIERIAALRGWDQAPA